MSTENTNLNLLNLAEEIKSRPILTEYLTKTKRGYICFCGNGSGEDGTGAEISKDGTRLLCGVCMKGYSNIDVIAHHLGLGTTGKDFVEVVKFGCQLFGIPFFDNKKARVLESNSKKNFNFTNAGNSDFSILSARKSEVNLEGIDSDMSTDTTVTVASKDDLFTTEEIALVINVTPRTLRKWNEKRIFEPFLIDHHGNFYYTREQMEQLKSVYHKDWHKPHKRRSEFPGSSPGQNVKADPGSSPGQNVKADPGSSPGQNVKAEPVAEFAQLAEAQKNLPSFVESQGGFWRGLSLETLQRIKCGYLPSVYFPADKTKLPAIVIPNDLNGVYFRAIGGKFHKNNKPMATTTVYLPDTDSFDLIVVEGQINAASIFQAVQQVTDHFPDFGIMAGSGTGAAQNLILPKLQELSDAGKKFRVLIAFDNDTNNAGQNAAQKLLKTLIKAGFNACTIDITKTPDIDCNDVLQQEGGEFKLFDMVNNSILNIAQDVSTDENIADADSFDLHQNRPATDDNGEIDSLELAKSSIQDDLLVDPELEKLFIPTPYTVTNHGIKKVTSKGITTVCPRPILVKDKFFNLDDKTYKLTLEYMTNNHNWKSIPAKGKEVIFHKNRIIDLAAYGLPVTSGNSAKVVDWLFNLDLANEFSIPLTYTVNRCGWYSYNGNDYFVDPRIENTITDENTGNKHNLIVDTDNAMAKDLKTAGTLEEWIKAYKLALSSPVARLNIAASVAAPLLQVLGERNFVLYTHGKTRGGKSTALYLGASAVGTSNLVRVFDATNNGLTAMAAETNHYPFFVDEKQAADNKLKQNFTTWIYNDANGTERTRANKDGVVKPARTWQHITICNGETVLLDDNATGGAHTRILQIAAPDTILSPDDCKTIRQIIGKNYGHAYPLFVKQLMKEDFDELQERYQNLQEIFKARCDENGVDILQEHIKKIALLYIADQILNDALDAAVGYQVTRTQLNFDEIFNLLPTAEETDDTAREIEAIKGFIVEKAAHFIASENYNKDRGLDIFGRSCQSEIFTFLTVSALKIFCKDKNYDYEKSVSDCIKRGFFVPDDKVRGNRKSALNTVQKKLGDGFKANCYQIPNKFIYGDNESED